MSNQKLAGRHPPQRKGPKSSTKPPVVDKLPGLAARQVATTLLTRIIDDGRGMDGLLDTRHGPPALRELNSADQGLVRAIATTACRHHGEVEFALGKVLDRKLPQKARHLIHTLHVAAAQILFMDVPDSAAVNLAVQSLRGDERSTRFASLANAVLRRLSREKDDHFAGVMDGDRARLNVPSWLWKRMRKDFGRERSLQIAQAHMLEPVLDITVKSSAEEWANRFGGVHVFGTTVRVNAVGAVTELPGFDDGEWWVQDAAASLPAHLMGDVAGKKVADLCSAPGGKTAQLANMGAVVTAVEQSGDRLKRLKANLHRLNQNVDCVEADLFEWEPDELFDAVLLDAPCSSTGTIRRHPDVQWTKSVAQVEALAQLQGSMIVRASEFLRPGGILVFSNCSIDRAEGEDVVADILAVQDQHGLQLESIASDDVFGLDEIVTRQGTVRTLPCHLQDVAPPDETAGIDRRRLSGLDGFFAARFSKKS